MSDTGIQIPEGWRPDEGDTLTGKVTALDKGWSDYASSFYPIVTIQPDSGAAVNVHCFHHVLRNRMRAIRPGIGDRLTVTYHGQRDTKDGKRKVSLYTVESDKPQDADAFWGSEPALVIPTPAPPEDGGDIPF